MARHYKRKGIGMPIGSSHKWNYAEHNYTSRGPNFTIVQSKGRNTRAPRGSGMPIGSNLIWGISGTQSVGRPRYIKGYGTVTPVVLKGIKRQIKYKIPRRRWK